MAVTGTYYPDMETEGVIYDPSKNLGSSAYNYRYVFGDILSGAHAAGKQAEAQAALDAKEWARNEYSAQQQRAFEEYMSNTQIQRQMADIKAAGLNPWLAVQSAGFGGASPAGAVANSSAGQINPGTGNVGSTLAGTAIGLAAILKVVAKFLK